MSRTVSEGFQVEVEKVAEAQSVKVASALSSKTLTYITSDSLPFLLFTKRQTQLSQLKPADAKWLPLFLAPMLFTTTNIFPSLTS